MWGQQEAIKNVEPLCIVLAVGPGFYMTGAKQFGYRKSRDGAAIVPILQQSKAENVLAYTLNNGAFYFCGTRKNSRLRLEYSEQFIG